VPVSPDETSFRAPISTAKKIWEIEVSQSKDKGNSGLVWWVHYLIGLKLQK
jgi:hypothetical protein